MSASIILAMRETPHSLLMAKWLTFCAMNEHNLSQFQRPACATALPQTIPPRRILVVDDDSCIRRVSAELLSRFGYHVDVAEDGAFAWDALQRNRYDLLVTDSNMPRVSGVELLKKLHGTPMALPVIMATGAFPQEEFIRHPWLQPAATLLKPYTGEELLRTVQEVLRSTNGAHEPDAPWPRQPLENRLKL